jgi:hypothetical protein
MEDEKFHPEPPNALEKKRKDFDLTLLEGKNYRERAEIETSRDLSKSVEQLLCDFHDVAEQVINPQTRHAIENVEWYSLQAQKRMVGMMAKVALENRRLQNWMLVLTIIIAFLTIAICWLTLEMEKQDKFQAAHSSIAASSEVQVSKAISALPNQTSTNSHN